MISGFATSQLMLGSVIPGFRQQLAPIRLATYMDHSNEALLMKRRKTVDPLIKFPKMNQDHSVGHAFMEKLKQLMAGQQHSGVYGPHQTPPQPEMREGYQRLRENRAWRNF